MKTLTIILCPEMGKTVSKQMLQIITTFIGTRYCTTDSNAPAIELSCDLHEDEKIHIAKMMLDNYNCVTFFIYSDTDRNLTASNYCDLNVIYNDSNND